MGWEELSKHAYYFQAMRLDTRIFGEKTLLGERVGGCVANEKMPMRQRKNFR